jgi:hypothetical protein
MLGSGITAVALGLDKADACSGQTPFEVEVPAWGAPRIGNRDETAPVG